jgi:hypothetical protein
MTDLRSALEKYLSMRKGFGYKSPFQNLPSRALRAMREQAMLVNALWISIGRS